jgi:hypothetical protein
MQNCGCSTEPTRHLLVMTNAELRDTSGVDWITEDGVHLRLNLQTFMQDARQSYWNFRLTLLESSGGMHVRRIHGHFGFVSNPVVLTPARTTFRLTAEHPSIMQPFVCSEITVAIAPTAPRGANRLRAVHSSAEISTSDFKGKNAKATATEEIWSPFTDTVMPLSWWVERRCVSGVRHSRWCVNAPYVYCQARICSQGEDGSVSCGSWEYEHDGCAPLC